MVSVNKGGMRVVREILENIEELGCELIRMECGVNLIDMGCKTPGSWKAGVLFTKACIGDLGIVQLGEYKINDKFSVTSAEIFIDRPVTACLASQIAGWRIGEGDFAPIGSGPARALAARDSDRYFKMTDYRDSYHEAVLCIQNDTYPTEEQAAFVAQACGVKPEDTYLLITSNTSIVCSIEVCARPLEQVCHKMFEKGFDPAQVVACRGKAPIAPICDDRYKTMGRINDSVIYGGDTEFWVRSDDKTIAKTIHQLTSNTSSPHYGEPFIEVFKRSNLDFFQVDYDVHSIAKIQIHNITTGNSFVAGEINYKILEESFLK